MSRDPDIHAVLLALPGDTLLLPNAAIAEVLSAERLRPAKDGPAWLEGTLPHEDRLLRVVRFEALNGGSRGGESRRTRLAVVTAFTGRLQAGRYAVVCQGHPNLVTLNRDALKSEPRHPTDRKDLALARVRIANTSAVIPNLELIEAELAKLDQKH